MWAAWFAQQSVDHLQTEYVTVELIGKIIKKVVLAPSRRPSLWKGCAVMPRSANAQLGMRSDSEPEDRVDQDSDSDDDTCF